MKKDLNAKRVAPKKTKKDNNKIEKIIFIFDSHLIPLLTPEAADSVEASIIITSAIN
jgi:hypothetical protein